MKSAVRKALSWTPRESFVWVSTPSPAWHGRGRPLSLGWTSCRASWQEGLGTQTTGFPCPPDRDECSDGPSPCSHSCHNGPGRFSCSCPAGFALAGDDRSCRGEGAPGGSGVRALARRHARRSWPGSEGTGCQPGGSNALCPLETFCCKGCRWERLKYWRVLGVPKEIHMATMCSRHLYPLSLSTTSEVILILSGHCQ